MVERGRDRDAVPFGDVADEEHLARRRGGRQGTEDSQLAQPPRRHDRDEQRDAQKGSGPWNGTPLPAVPQERDPESGQDEESVVARERRQTREQSGEREGLR